ncbi:PREDICTED: gamma-aminobutyric acid receptor subunit beta-like [Branchiostoma belcheri]|uniref:Gamma-aminobutyric acid receptor subunit beta-like n=1 Tax=Branchiostoma belcheri TaxID=7741 RepID=A0A6P4ZAA1_BRABE|nr:PREDICTED: gamma-aminobutyric acid receptor subunit beta-like [Branchiostoma belcheri]
MDDPNKEALDPRLKWQENVIAQLKQINKALESSGKWYASREEQIRVLITPTLFSLRDVDTVKQEFSAELWFEIFYKDEKLKGITNRDDVDWDNQWDPRIVLRNTTSIETERSAQNLIQVVGVPNSDEPTVPIVHELRKVRATFKVDMDLADFPVDHQELTVQLMSGWPIKKADLRKNYGSNDTIAQDDFADRDQWTVSKYVDCKHGTKTNIQSKTFGEYPVYNITAHVQRKSAFYSWNTALILYIIIALSFTVFSIPLEDHKDRLGITFTLLLTTVAFKLVVSQYLPTVSYLTLLDKYVLGCIIFQCVVAVQNTVASVIRDKERARLFDGVCVGLFGTAVLLAHLFIGIVVWMKWKKNSGKLQEVDNKFEGLSEKINRAYEVRDMKVPGSTKSNMIIKGFDKKEIQEVIVALI